MWSPHVGSKVLNYKVARALANDMKVRIIEGTSLGIAVSCQNVFFLTSRYLVPPTLHGFNPLSFITERDAWNTKPHRFLLNAARVRKDNVGGFF